MHTRRTLALSTLIAALTASTTLTVPGVVQAAPASGIRYPEGLLQSQMGKPFRKPVFEEQERARPVVASAVPEEAPVLEQAVPAEQAQPQVVLAVVPRHHRQESSSLEHRYLRRSCRRLHHQV